MVSKKGIELPMTFIIFMIIIVVLFAFILIWNLGGVKTFTNVTDTVNKGMIENISSGRVSLG